MRVKPERKRVTEVSIQTEDVITEITYATYPQRIISLLIDAALLYGSFFVLTPNRAFCV